MFSGKQARDELRQRLKLAKAGKDTAAVNEILKGDPSLAPAYLHDK